MGYTHQSGIANLEGRATGRGNKLAKIAQVLEVPVAWLLGRPDSATVPFVRSVPPSALPRAVTPVAQTSRPFDTLPFRTIEPSRIELLLARLGATRAAVALD